MRALLIHGASAAATTAVFAALTQLVVVPVLPRDEDYDWTRSIRLALPLAALLASIAAAAVGRLIGAQRRLLGLDLISAAATVAVIFALTRGAISSDAAGMLVALFVVSRFAPAVSMLALVAAPARAAFAVSLCVYVALAGWHVSASVPAGDQVHYLLAVERLAQGSLDATIDAARYRAYMLAEPTAAELVVHGSNVPAGLRLTQGYSLPALLAPGWWAGGQAGIVLAEIVGKERAGGPVSQTGARLGAEAVIALVAAFASAQTYLLLRETAGDRGVARVAWALASFLPPLLPLAYHIFPNAVGAAIAVTGYRYAFTAPRRRPLLAGAVLALGLLFTPRQGLVLLALAPFAWWLGGARARFAGGVAAAALAAAALNAITHGVPLPYAGYVAGTAALEAYEGEAAVDTSLALRVPALLFDRTYGIAGSAPWLFLGALGAAPAFRTGWRIYAPAAAAVVLSVATLALTRFWAGGYSPPNRYFVDILPLIAPFAAHGLLALRPWPARAFAAAALFVSAVAAIVIVAVPGRALNSGVEDKLQQAYDALLPLNLVGWLPTFDLARADPIDLAWRVAVAAIAVAALAWAGLRSRPIA